MHIYIYILYWFIDLLGCGVDADSLRQKVGPSRVWMFFFGYVRLELGIQPLRDGHGCV